MLDFATSDGRPKRPNVKRRELHDPSRAPGVDMRTSAGRRFSRIADSLVREFVDADPVRLREVAALKLAAEKILASVVAGDEAARKSLVKISDLLDRRERELRAGRAASSSIDAHRSGVA